MMVTLSLLSAGSLFFVICAGSTAKLRAVGRAE